jgi:hypothetical protein
MAGLVLSAPPPPPTPNPLLGCWGGRDGGGDKLRQLPKRGGDTINTPTLYKELAVSGLYNCPAHICASHRIRIPEQALG